LTYQKRNKAKTMRTGEGYSGNMFIGSKYNETANLGISDIAKLVRTELKATYPNCKFSVTIDRYSGGQSMDVTIKSTDFNPFSSEFIAHLKSNNPLREWNANTQFVYQSTPTYSKEYEELEQKVRAILNQYNYDDTDTQRDYFDVRFYSHVRFDNNSNIAAHYPEHIETKKRIDEDEAYEKKRKAQNLAIKEQKEKISGGYKKGDVVVYSYKGSKYIPQGDYEAVIRKVPNGRALFSRIEIFFKVNKRFDAIGNVVDSKEVGYHAEVRDLKEIKPNKIDRRKKLIKDFLANA
jgi:hypothetical protein